MPSSKRNPDIRMWGIPFVVTAKVLLIKKSTAGV